MDAIYTFSFLVSFLSLDSAFSPSFSQEMGENKILMKKSNFQGILVNADEKQLKKTAHDTYQNQKMDSHLEVASEKHTAIIERLATIETRVTLGVAIGTLVLVGLILPWIRKKMRLTVLILILIGSLSCNKTSEPIIISGGCIPCNQQRCYTQDECIGEGVCYCDEFGYCVDAFP